MTEISRNTNIAYNTAFLYVRMLVIMLVQFFTVRITLKYLGVIDYGIFNVVCGVTNVLTFLTHTMTSASQRFFAYDLGQQNYKQLKKTFDTFVSLFSLCGLVGVLILAVVGNWFICNHLIIPAERLSSALFAFYFTLLSFFISMFTIPFNSLIIAHEDMRTFAYVSVSDAVLKLLIVYCLVVFPVDKLKLYAALMAFAYLVPSMLYIGYCFKRYEEVTIKRDVDWSLSQKILPFMSFNLLGGLSWMFCTQGLSILINMFFGPIVNASKAISDKVNGSFNGFTNNFMMAVQPQMVKTYASGDIDAMHEVLFMSSNLSFFLILVLNLPVVVNADALLRLWLEDPSPLTTVMVQLVLLFSLIGALETPINQAIRATGNIRNYQVYVGLITLLVIPVAWIMFKLRLPAYYGYIALIVVYGIAYIARLYYLKKQIKIAYKTYFVRVLKKCSLCFVLCVVILWIVEHYLRRIDVYPLISWIICLALTVIIVYYIGFGSTEKAKLQHVIFNIKNAFKK